eukprot:COSAG02_NODE_56144_length_287_cov_0.500000_1_plen_66_part_01
MLVVLVLGGMLFVVVVGFGCGCVEEGVGGGGGGGRRDDCRHGLAAGQTNTLRGAGKTRVWEGSSSG